MGVIIDYPDGSKKYASIGTVPINIMKVLEPVQGSDEMLVRWRIHGNVSIWSTGSKETINTPNSYAYEIAHNEIKCETDEYPTNPHTLLYNKFKTTLFSYTDDI